MNVSRCNEKVSSQEFRFISIQTMLKKPGKKAVKMLYQISLKWQHNYFEVFAHMNQTSAGVGV